MWRRGGPARTTTKAAAAAAAAACLSLVLLSSAPRGVDCSRARRRHPSPEQSNRKPAFLATKQGLTQEDTPIPGVSIWTSRAAASSPGGASAAVRKAQQPDGASRVVAGAMPRDGACCGGGSGDLLGDCQVRGECSCWWWRCYSFTKAVLYYNNYHTLLVLWTCLQLTAQLQLYD